MHTITAGSTLTTRSICDADCFFSLSVIERKGSWATISYDKKNRRTKIRTDYQGREYLMPDRYSMAPIFRA